MKVHSCINSSGYKCALTSEKLLFQGVMDVACYVLLMSVILKELPTTRLDEGGCLVLEPKECILHVPQGTLLSPVVS